MVINVNINIIALATLHIIDFFLDFSEMVVQVGRCWLWSLGGAGCGTGRGGAGCGAGRGGAGCGAGRGGA